MRYFLRYPVKNLERFSTNEKKKLFDAVVFYVPEKVSVWYKIVRFLKGEQ